MLVKIVAVVECWSSSPKRKSPAGPFILSCSDDYRTASELHSVTSSFTRTHFILSCLYSLCFLAISYNSLYSSFLSLSLRLILINHLSNFGRNAKFGFFLFRFFNWLQLVGFVFLNSSSFCCPSQNHSRTVFTEHD